MRYKLVACDLDGTLLNDNSSVSKENLKAIEKINKSKIIFALVTGRTLFEIPQELLECDDIRYIIYSDGAVAYDKRLKKEIFCKYISTGTALKIYHLLKKYDAMIEIYESTHPVTEATNLNSKSYDYFNIDRDYRPVIDKTRIGVEDLEEYIKENRRIEIFNIFFKHLEERDECAKILKGDFDICVTTSMDNNIEITAQAVSKGKALERLCNHLRIDGRNVIAAGDSLNDLSMFDYAGTPLSAGNAQQYVKEYTGNTICTNNEHIAKYIWENILEVQ